MTTAFTTNFGLEKPDFRSEDWGSRVVRGTDTIDRVIQAALQTANVIAWTPNTVMASGAIRSDNTTTPATYWTCSVPHTSGAGTFVADRAAHPTFWVALSSIITPRGVWAQNTAYAFNDLAYEIATGIVGICKTPHTSTAIGTMSTDASKWNFLVDLPIPGVVAATTISFNNTGTTSKSTNCYCSNGYKA